MQYFLSNISIHSSAIKLFCVVVYSSGPKNMQRKRAGTDTEKDATTKYCGVSPEVERNTRWLSVWRQAVKEQRCLDNCDALLIIAEHLTVSSPHTHARIMNTVL